MARAYTVGTVALALGVTPKWIDNLLSHHAVPGVLQHRQGVARRVTTEGLLQLAISVRLIRDLELSIGSALQLARALTSNGGAHTTPGGIGIDIDLTKARAELEVKVSQAVEIAPVPRRGRPRSPDSASSSKTGRLE